MIVPVELDIICIKVYIEDQQTLEEMMAKHGMSYGHSKFPAISSNHHRRANEGVAIYYAVHQEKNDHGKEMKFYKDLSKGPIVAKMWTMSMDDYCEIAKRLN